MSKLKNFDLYELAENRYLQGDSLTKISKELKIGRISFTKYLKAKGVQITNSQSLPRVKENIFEAIDTEEKAYWLGFLYADGCLSANTRISITLKSDDAKHLEKFKEFLGWTGEVKITTRDGYSRAIISFRCKKMFQDLVSLGCYPNKSLTLRFPSSKQVPNNLILPFVRGYVDGDGYLGILTRNGSKGLLYYPRISIAGTESFLEELIKVLNWKPNAICKQGKICTIEWQGQIAKTYVKQLYENSSIHLDRKKRLAENMPFK